MTFDEWYKNAKIFPPGTRAQMKMAYEAGRSDVQSQRDSALEEAAALVEDIGKAVEESETQDHGYDKHGHGDMARQYAINIRALKRPDEVSQRPQPDASDDYAKDWLGGISTDDTHR